MQETPPNILCMSRAYRPSGNWQPQEYTRIMYPAFIFERFCQESVTCGNPKPWSGHLELLWPQLSVWPNIAVALAGLGWISLSLFGSWRWVFWVPCYHPEVLLTSCYHAAEAPQTQHTNTSCGSKSMFCQGSIASKYKRYQDLQTTSNCFHAFSLKQRFWLLSIWIYLCHSPLQRQMQFADSARQQKSKQFIKPYQEKRRSAPAERKHQTVQVSCQNGN